MADLLRLYPWDSIMRITSAQVPLSPSSVTKSRETLSTLADLRGIQREPHASKMSASWSSCSTVKAAETNIWSPLTRLATAFASRLERPAASFFPDSMERMAVEWRTFCRIVRARALAASSSDVQQRERPFVRCWYCCTARATNFFRWATFATTAPARRESPSEALPNIVRIALNLASAPPASSRCSRNSFLSRKTARMSRAAETTPTRLLRMHSATVSRWETEASFRSMILCARARVLAPGSASLASPEAQRDATGTQICRMRLSTLTLSKRKQPKTFEAPLLAKKRSTSRDSVPSPPLCARSCCSLSSSEDTWPASTR
mmetsp:Transcript_3007/g.6817  ORF Transcript_3007/g.6817 Transcript_3007/m.6817 type:complete len:320 (-) Transcript_3007:956-1915(-)